MPHNRYYDPRTGSFLSKDPVHVEKPIVPNPLEWVFSFCSLGFEP